MAQNLPALAWSSRVHSAVGSDHLATLASAPTRTVEVGTGLAGRDEELGLLATRNERLFGVSVIAVLVAIEEELMEPIKPIALAYPRKDVKIEKGRYGTMMPVTPANGFTLVCKTKPGTGDAIRTAGRRLEEAVKNNPDVLAVLRLHYLRWALFDNDTRFIYIGIFDTDFDKYVEDAVSLFKRLGLNTMFEYLEGFPEDWRENPAAFAKFAREHQVPSFVEYAEYPYITGVEVVKALTVKQGLTEVLDQLQ